jgi:Ribbon-helix-helix domain
LVVQKIQVFLREDQRTALKSLSTRTGVRQSDLVRRGVDLLLEGAARQTLDWRQATRQAAGLWRDRQGDDMDAGELRKSAKRRFPAIYGR